MTVLKALRTAAAYAADKTAMDAIYGTNGYYETLAAWWAAVPSTLDDIYQIDCYDDWSGGLNEKFIMTSKTATSSYYPVISSVDAEYHGGVVDGGFILLEKQGDQYGINIQCPYTRVENIQFTCEYDTYTNDAVVYVYASNVTIKNCIINNETGGKGAITQSSSVSTSGLKIINTLIACTSGSVSSKQGIRLQSDGSAEIDNCTVYGYAIGYYTINASHDALVKNTVVHNCTTSYSVAGSVDSSSTNNAATDYIDAIGSNPLETDIVDGDFNDESTYDFSIASGSSLIGEGADLSSDFTDDIAGTTRS